MAEKGYVTEIKGNLAVIKMKRTEACAKCRACIAGMTEKEMIMEAENNCGAEVGDWVELEVSESGFFFAVGIMYGIPLAAFLCGIFLGYFAIFPTLLPNMDKESGSFLLGVLLTVLAYGWIRSQEKRWEAKKIRPVATRITTPEPDTM